MTASKPPHVPDQHFDIKEAETHYVNNREFYILIKDFIEKQRGVKERLPIPNRIGEIFLLIAIRYSMKPMFAPYHNRDEMIGTALELMCKYISSFNPDSAKNPFSYFTAVCHNAFLATIKKDTRVMKINEREFDRKNLDPEGEVMETPICDWHFSV